MSSSKVLHHIDLVKTDVSVERITSIIRVTRIGKLGTLAGIQLLITANIPSSPISVTLMMEAICFSETSIFTRST
jgi:hypothetical protein